MPGIYRPRHQERTVLYRVQFHHFCRFLAEYERRFEREYGYFRPVVKEVIERYLDCGNPRSGFALMNRSRFMRTVQRCPDPLPGLPSGTPVENFVQDAGALPIIVAIQAFGDRINFQPHLHLLVTEGGIDRAGIFHRIAHLDDLRLAGLKGGG